MCSHYEAPSPHLVAEAFGVAPFEQGRLDLWPGYIGPFLRSLDGRAEDEESPAAMCNDLQSKWPRPAIIAFFDRD
ncbi:hypothetical protein ALP02_200168 [Pseudomonas coronafaciens pv. garcae]|nr:hypothetical protein ALP02_200168 [Pseudomonas coronafaciens pv. garcae]